MKAKIIFVLGVFICILFSISLLDVIALGISPVKSVVRKTNETYFFTIVNSEHEDFDVVIYPEGEIADFIALSDTQLHFSSDEFSKKVYFKLNPNTPPGSYFGGIVVQQAIPYFKIGDNIVAARVRLSHKVNVELPYPKKYIKASLFSDIKNKTVELGLWLRNLGGERIENVEAHMAVKEKEKTLVDFVGEASGLNPGEEKILSNSFSRELFDNGAYQFVSTVEYDENSIELLDKIVIGNPVIKLKYHTKKLIRGKINKMYFYFYNDWNEKLDDIEIEFDIIRDNEIVGNGKVSKFSLLPKTTNKICSFVEVPSYMKPGNYKLIIEIHGGNRTFKFDSDIAVKRNFLVENLIWLYLMPAVFMLIVSTILLLKYLPRKKHG